MKFFLPLIFCFALCLAPCKTAFCEKAAVTQEASNLLLEKIENRFSQIRTLKTRFSQKKNIAVFSHPVMSSGFLLFKSPDKLRLQFTEPFESCMVINGRDVLRYEKNGSQWQKLDNGDKQLTLMIMKNITSWLQGHYNAPGIYDISLLKKEAVSILLTPRSEEFKTFISHFRLDLKKDLTGLSSILIQESQDNYTRISFYQDMVNIPVSDDLFTEGETGPKEVPEW